MRRFFLLLVVACSFAVGAVAWAEGAWTSYVSCGAVTPVQLPAYVPANYSRSMLVQWQAQNQGPHAIYLGTSASMVVTATNGGTTLTRINSNGGLFNDTAFAGEGTLNPNTWWCLTFPGSGASVLAINGHTR